MGRQRIASSLPGVWRQLRSAFTPLLLIATSSGLASPQPLSASTQTATLLPKQLGLLVSSATDDFHFVPILKRPRPLRLERAMALRSFHATWSRHRKLSW